MIRRFPFLKPMLRKFVISSMALSLVWTTIACGASDTAYNQQPTQTTTSQPQARPASQSQATSAIANGTYPVQQATYDDSSGEYSLMLLNTPPGQSMFRSANLPLARLTEEEVSAGKTSELRVENNQPALYLTPDFRIEYVHNVTETQTNPQTGQQEVVVVRQESNFWTPFAGALAGQAIGSLLFRPQYYMPPVFTPGVALIGYGGYGRSYNEAVSRYQSRYQAPPAEYRNRQFRSTGRLRSNSGTARTPGFGSGSNVRRTPGFGSGSGVQRSPSVNTAPRTNTNRPSGSGFGNSTLRRNNRPTERVRPSGGGFGSSRRAAPRIRRR